MGRQLDAENGASEARLRAQGHCRRQAAPRAGDLTQEPGDGTPTKRLLGRPLDRVERVTADELGVKASKDIGPTGVVKAGERAADPGDHAALAILPWQCS